MMATESRGASNAKAPRELGRVLRHPTWRDGFRAYTSPTPDVEAARRLDAPR